MSIRRREKESGANKALHQTLTRLVSVSAGELDVMCKKRPITKMFHTVAKCYNNATLSNIGGNHDYSGTRF